MKSRIKMSQFSVVRVRKTIDIQGSKLFLYEIQGFSVNSPFVCVLEFRDCVHKFVFSCWNPKSNDFVGVLDAYCKNLEGELLQVILWAAHIQNSGYIPIVGIP